MRHRIHPPVPFRLLRSALWLLAGLCALPVMAQVPPPAHWKNEIDTLVARDRADPPPQHGVLFVGSSSIRFWTSLADDFSGVPVVRHGFGGSAIADSTFYADRIVVPVHPRLIVLYAGDNDIAGGHSPQQVVDDFKTFVARVRRDLPRVAVAFVAIKPSVARAALWPKMREANAGVRAWAATQRDVRYVDTATPMLDAHGRPRPELLREDGLHMTPAGYAIWTRTLRPVLADYGFAPEPAGAR